MMRAHWIQKLLVVSVVLLLARQGFGAEPEHYKLGPGDLVEISVWKDESLTKQMIVPPDGVLSFPLVGDIDVNKLTVTQLRSTLAERLADYIPDPTVSAMLLKPESMRAFVIGKVNNPGMFPITLETNVMQILAMAGGLNPFAASSKILILRQEGGQTVKVPFDYPRVEKGENLEQNVLLKRGDVVVVP
jgi:polysaccharide export outer membrane protein